METRTGPKSINQLSEASKKYTKNEKRISRDTITKYSRFWKDVILKRVRGRKGCQIISKKNYEEHAHVREQVKDKFREMLKASFRVLIQRKITDAFNEGREYITLPEINQVFKEVRREMMRPKVGNLFGRPQDKSAWEKKS